MESEDAENIALWMMGDPLWQRYGLTIESITDQFHDAIVQKSFIYVAELIAESMVVGFAWLIPDAVFARSPYLKQIGVHPEYTHHGIGRQLLTVVEDDCKRFSDQLFLLVSDFNTEAQKFYRRQGYQNIGRIPAYVLTDVDELIFHKRLLK